MANQVKFKRSDVADKAPTTSDLALGELAMNTRDGKVFMKKDVDGTESIVEVGANTFEAGTASDDVPINSYLGQLAFLDEVSRWIPAASLPTNNLDINFEYVSDTSINIRMRGSDGVVRSTTLTLS